MRTRGLLSRIALSTHRTREDSQKLATQHSLLAKYLLYGASALAFAVLLMPALGELMSDWNRIKPRSVVPESQWKVLFRSSRHPCPYDAGLAKDCPANPANPELWNSTETRATSDHYDKVAKMQGHVFWIGTTIPVKALREAALARSNYFLLGWVRATYRLWVDGRFQLGSDRSHIDPVVLSLPITRLLEPRPLTIAIEVTHDSEHPYPDYFNAGLGGEGFLTFDQASDYRTYRALINKIRPFSIFLIHLSVSLLFFLVWTSSSRKQEYFYMALFSLASAATQLIDVDSIYAHLGPSTYYAYRCVLRMLSGSLLMFLGFSFSRMRRDVFKWGIPLALTASLLLPISLSGPSASFYFLEHFSKWILPSFCAAGIASCLLQAYYLFSRRAAGHYLPVRIARLLYFSASLALIGSLNWLYSLASVAIHLQANWLPCFDLIFVCALGAIVFSEYRERELQAELAPASEYHRRAVLPEKIGGVVLVADLKASEQFYRHRAVQGDSRNLVTIWRTHFYTSIMRFGGMILHTKGDEVIGFFDDEKCAQPMLAAIHAVEDMAQNSIWLDAEFKNQHLYPPSAKGLFFRASAAYGEIRPIWETMGSTREASWEEAGTTSVFVESARLLETERKFGNQHSTLLMLFETTAAQVCETESRLREKFTDRDQVALDKHGNEYRVAVYSPGGAGSALKRAA